MTIRQFFYNLKEVQPVKVELAENEYRKLEEQVNGALPAEHISGGSTSIQTVPPVLIQYETAKENYEREKKKYEKMLKKAETYIEELKIRYATQSCGSGTCSIGRGTQLKSRITSSTIER